MSLPLPLAQAAQLFSEKFFVYDVNTTLINGRWVNTQDPDRLIYGVIQTKDTKSIKLGSDGALSDGTLLLHTKNTIHAYDQSLETGDTTIQTYIRYVDNIWKLQSLDNWKTKDQGYNQYVLIRHTVLP